jgi:hypothetical protein
VYSYVDKLTIWLKQPLAKRQLAWLRGQCGTGGLHTLDQRARFDRSYVQRLQLNQPTHEAIQSLISLADSHLTYVEVALDWTFDDEEVRDAAFAFVVRHHVKRWHRDQGIRFVKGVTRYTGPRSARTVLASYADRHCKISGELYCVHLEWRMRGVETLRRAGITCVADLLKLDHRRFWQDRLLMRDLHLRDLGRMYNIHVAGKGYRRGPWITFSGQNKQFAYDKDLRAGSLIVRALGSTQAVIDQYRKWFNVNQCLCDIDVRHLLPPTHDYDYAPKRIRSDLPTLIHNEKTQISGQNIPTMGEI